MIGFFGGTFDPVHHGHIALALAMVEHGLKEVWFCPAKRNPFKQTDAPEEVEHRLNMLRLATERIPEFKVLDIEAKREGNSYTVDTLRTLVREQKNSSHPEEIRLILGGDLLKGFMDWKDAREILELAKPIVGGRCSKENYDSIPKELKDQNIFIDIPILEISSTQIRQRIKQNLYIEHLVPPKVVDYIKSHGLYSCRKL